MCRGEDANDGGACEAWEITIDILSHVFYYAKPNIMISAFLARI